MATVYRLPDWLGGSAVTDVTELDGTQDVWVSVPDAGEGNMIRIHRRHLVEVRPPSAEDHLRELRSQIEAVRDMASKDEDATRHDDRGSVHGWYRRRLNSVLSDPATGGE